MGRMYGAMIALGLLWGLAIPLGKVAMSTGHSPLGYVAWQTIYMTGFLSLLIALRGGRFPVARAFWGLFAVVAVAGTLLSNSASYRALIDLPAGFMAIVIALVPMAAFPMALATGLERWSWARLAGVVLGAVAVVLLVAPGSGLPDRSAVWFVALALVAPVSYAAEGTYLALRGTRGLDPIEVLWGASVLGMAVAVPVAVTFGAWIDPLVPWGAAEWAILGASICHGIAYTGYVWLVGAAGSVFAAQVAYLVTGAGVLWSVSLLGERYDGQVWIALAVMLAGMALVQPRHRRAGKGAVHNTA